MMETLWDVISVTCVFIVTLGLIFAAFGRIEVKTEIKTDIDED